jgi:predicted secreted protein
MRAIALAAALALTLIPLARAAETDIQLSETATRMMTPDRLRASLRLEVKGKSARAVQAELNTRMDTALAKAKSVASVTASTGAYSVGRSGLLNDAEPWQASQTLELTSGNFQSLLALAGELENQGLAISDLNFFLAPETVKGVEGMLTGQALAALKVRADQVARDMGLAVDHFGKVEVGNATAYAPFRPMPMMAAATMPARAAPPVAEPGDSTVSLTVSADVVLMPAK